MIIKRYFLHLYHSLTSQDAYVDFLMVPFWQSLLFFFVTLGFLSCSSVLFFWYRQLPVWQQEIKQTYADLQTYYPETLEINWTGKELITKGTPVNISYPRFLQNSSVLTPQFLATLQPAEIATADLDSYPAWSIITPTQLHVRNTSEKWVNFTLNEFLNADQPFVLTKASLPTTILALQSGLEVASTIIKLLAVIVIPIALISVRLWGSILDTFLIYFFLRLNRTPLRFGKTWQLTLHLSLTAEIIFQATRWLYPNVKLPMFLISFWILFITIYFAIYKKLAFVNLVLQAKKASSNTNKGK